MQAALPFAPTADQQGFLYGVSDFLESKDKGKVYLLKGYAGTGKTSMVISLVSTLKAQKRKFVLLAPTGRAAKVLAGYTDQRAFTIHRMIYQISVDGAGNYFFGLRPNTSKNAVVIVDESSMIQGFSNDDNMLLKRKSLLADLMEFVEDGINCKLILIGDTAQLPPVGMTVSPALDPAYLSANYRFQKNQQFELTEVVRQAQESNILLNATGLRHAITAEEGQFEFNIDGKQVVNVDGYSLQDELESAYADFGDEGVLLVTRSNRSANQYNQQIRRTIKWMEEEIDVGDTIMVVKNNYTWLSKESKAGFIANGDMAEVMRVGSTQELHGLRFADVSIRLLDHHDEPELEVKVILDTLHSETTALPADDMMNLYESVRLDHAHLPSRKEQVKAFREDPFLNALQIKFGYAVTCHKAQGGQWPAVFIDQGYLTEEMMGTEHLRWLYTAVTRATEKVFLINFLKED